MHHDRHACRIRRLARQQHRLEPAGLADTINQGMILPTQAFYSADMKEFFLPYDSVGNSDSPETTLMDFCQTTYEAGADLAGWDRAALERPANQEEKTRVVS